MNIKKIFTLICGIIPLSVMAQQILPSLEANTTSRWTFSINGGYESNRINLNGVKAYSVMGGEIVSVEEDLSSDDLKMANDIYKYYQVSAVLNAGAEYRIWKGLSVRANVGIAKLDQKFNTEEMDVEFDSPANKYSFQYTVGLKYQWDITSRWFLIISPEFSQTLKASTAIPNEKDYDPEFVEESNMRADVAMKSWRVPLIGGYRFGKFIPYVGVQYHDLRMDATGSYDVVYGGEPTTNFTDQKYVSRTKFEGMAGVSYYILPKLSINVSSAFGNSWKVQGGINYTL